MKKTLIGAAAVALGLAGALAFVTPASAEPGGVVTTHGTELLDVGPNGYLGWSCPTGTTVVKGGYTWAEGVELLDVAKDEAMTPETVYPHHTTGKGETGWYVQNGATAQKLKVWVECTTPLTVVTPVEPAYTAPTCDAFGIVKPATTEGVKYEGKRNTDGTATVTATAEKGYVLKEGATSTWTFKTAKLTGDVCLTEVTLTKPEVVANCEGIWYTTPDEDKATYTVTDSSAGWFVVKATPKAGFKFKGDSEWKLTYTTPTNCPNPNPSPNPTPTDEPTATPSASETTPVANELPVTGGGSGVNVPAVFGVAGIALITAGAGLLLVLRRRRDNKVEFSA